MGLLVGADQLTGKDWTAVNKGKGDAFMILLGMWGVIINGVQATLIERHRMKTTTWSGRNSLSPLLFEFEFAPSLILISVGLLFAYTVGAGIIASWTAAH